MYFEVFKVILGLFLRVLFCGVINSPTERDPARES
jgi:hypothetical protein